MQLPMDAWSGEGGKDSYLTSQISPSTWPPMGQQWGGVYVTDVMDCFHTLPT